MISFLVDLILKSNWDNTEVLSHYKGSVDIFRNVLPVFYW